MDKGYNFSSYLISIEGLYTKLWISEAVEVLISGISGLQLGSPETKRHLGVGPEAEYKEYYKGGRWWFPPSPGRGESCEFLFARGSSVH